MVAALCIPPLFAAAGGPAVLPSGTPLTIVSEATVDPAHARPGYVYKAHLQSALTLGGTILAPAGAPVTLLIVDVTRTAEPSLRIALQHFSIPAADATLPVAPVDADIPALTAGLPIAARTVGEVVVDGTRAMIRVPLPFALSSDAPNAAFTPVPYRTTAPVEPPRRRRDASPAPASSISPEPSPS